jgi:hypothetical protein
MDGNGSGISVCAVVVVVENNKVWLLVLYLVQVKCLHLNVLAVNPLLAQHLCLSTKLQWSQGFQMSRRKCLRTIVKQCVGQWLRPIVGPIVGTIVRSILTLTF